MQNRHILYLTHDGLTDPLGQSQILPYLSGLSKDGFEITVLSLEKAGRLRQSKSYIEEICNRSGISWHPLPYFTFPPILSPILNLLRMQRRAIKEWNSNPYYLVHCRSYLASWVGIRLKRKLRIKYLFDMRGFWADERRESGLWPQGHFVYDRVYAYFKSQEKKYLSEADHIVTLTTSATRIIEQWGLNTCSISVIPTCVDLVHFNPDRISSQNVKELRSKLGIQSNQYVLVYLGSWGTWYLTSEMLRFYKTLNSMLPSVLLVLTPDTKSVPVMSGIIAREVSRNKLPEYLKLADASIFFISPTFSKKGSSATKMGELLAMNVPIITNSGWGDVDEIIKVSNCGYLVSNFTESEYTKCVEEYINHSKPAKFRSTAENYFNLSTGIKQYKMIYKDLAQL